MRHPDQVKQYLQEDEFKVYKLIWQRFVASQMNPAVFDQTTVDIDAKSGSDVFWFRVTGSVMKFDGFLKVYEESKEGKDEEDEELKHKLPALEAGQKLTLKSLQPEQHFTEPPPRFNEASLVKELEERGIGRPSTYATILSTIQERQYVTKTGGKFAPDRNRFGRHRSAGREFQGHLRSRSTRPAWKKNSTRSKKARRSGPTRSPSSTRSSPRISNTPRSTWKTSSVWRSRRTKSANAAGHRWSSSGASTDPSTRAARTTRKIRNSCTFTKENPINLPDLDSADLQETTQEEYCENCGRVMVLKRGRFGQFMACTGYPDCKTTRRLDQGKRVPDIPLDEKCPECGPQHDHPPRTLRRVHFLQRISRLQVREAELHRREVSATARKANWSRSAPARATPSTDARSIRSASSHRPRSRFRKSARAAAASTWSSAIAKTASVIACPNKECDYERDGQQMRRSALKKAGYEVHQPRSSGCQSRRRVG